MTFQLQTQQLHISHSVCDAMLLDTRDEVSEMEHFEISVFH